MTGIARRRLVRWRPGDDAGSLAMAMLLIIVAVALTALLAPMSVTQIQTTRSASGRSHAVYAAEAGLEALMAQIRAADDGSGAGVRADLPCGPISGQVGGGTTERYQVTVFYTNFDPQAQMTSATSWFAANDINCVPGSGPGTLPQYAVAFSVGTDSGTSRTLNGAYRLRTSNQNIAGGRVHVLQTPTSTVDVCMDTGTTITPTAGTTLKMVTCDTTRKQQIFAYTQQSRLQLVNSVTSAQPLGMCLDAGSPLANGTLVTFQVCASPAPAQQQWLLQGGGQFESLNSSGNGTGYVMELTAPNFSGSTVKLTNSWSGGFNNMNSFSAESAVGPGNAGPQNSQLVNYKQFGRCFDLTSGDYHAGFMIAWPCKPSWNQAFHTPALATSLTSAVAGTITITVGTGNTTPAGLYCLQSPRSTAPGQYAVVVACTAAATTANLQWRMYGYTGNYDTSYRILDVDGNCLQPTDNEMPNPDIWTWGDKISKIVVQPCTGSTLQKWNANADILAGMDMKYVGENR